MLPDQHEDLKNQRGSILVYVLVMIAALSIFSISFSSTITNLQKHVSHSKTSINTNFDLTQMVRLIKLPNGLAESAGLADNSLLYTCLNGGTTSTCAENCCVHGTTAGFYYVDPSDTNTNVSLKRKLLGPQSAPTSYYFNGAPCTPTANNSAECAYSLWGTFTTVCPGGSATCEHAEHLKISVHLRANPKAFTNQVLMKDQDVDFIYFNDRNYKPSIVPIPDVTLYLGDGIDKEVSVLGDSGNPSEIQNFVFTKCISENPGTVQLTTPADQPFSGGVAKIRLKALAQGDAKITMQISDGALENNLSKEYSLNVKVIPGVSPP
ncbi:hypothetical protein [Bdellovibrio sp. BCCA]|uniref:hypothetical protein n=1 Tax=Bdellovibrio sp. BCCA TaxID=3136281 RepID=UPI0030F2B8DB